MCYNTANWDVFEPKQKNRNAAMGCFILTESKLGVFGVLYLLRMIALGYLDAISYASVQENGYIIRSILTLWRALRDVSVQVSVKICKLATLYLTLLHVVNVSRPSQSVHSTRT